MFKNLTMDASSIARSLPDNVSWLSQEAKRWRRGNVQKLNYGFPGKTLSPSVYDIRWKAFLPALVGTRKCCQRSTMDPAAKPPSLHTHVVRCSQETKKGGRGNVQKLNYGSPGRASLAPHAHLSARAAHPPGWAPQWAPQWAPLPFAAPLAFGTVGTLF